MNVTCLHCGHTFSFAGTGLQGSIETTACAVCGRDTPAIGNPDGGDPFDSQAPGLGTDYGLSPSMEAGLETFISGSMAPIAADLAPVALKPQEPRVVEAGDVQNKAGSLGVHGRLEDLDDFLSQSAPGSAGGDFNSPNPPAAPGRVPPTPYRPQSAQPSYDSRSADDPFAAIEDTGNSLGMSDSMGILLDTAPETEPSNPRQAAAEALGADPFLAVAGSLAGNFGPATVACTECGVQVTPSPDQLLPVCPACAEVQTRSFGSMAAGGDPFVANAPGPAVGTLAPLEGAAPTEGDGSWQVRKADGQIYGPFDEATIREWIRGRKIFYGEECSTNGLEWECFGSHEIFSGCFQKRESADFVAPAHDESMDFRKKDPLRAAFKFLRRSVAVLVILGGGAVATWYAVNQGLLVVPEDHLLRAQAFVMGQLQKQELLQPAEPAAGTQKSEAFTSLLERFGAEYGAAERSSMELFYRGRTLMLRDNRAALLEAKTSLEQAVLDDPGNVLALATLSELYNAMASRKLGALDLQRQSIYLIEEAERQEIYQAEVLRARSTFLIFSGNPAEGAAVAEKALEITPEDPTLHYLLGLAAEADASAEAGAAEAAFGRVLELDEGFHRIYFERGRSAELAGDLGGALREFQRQLAVEPASPSTHARMGDIYARLGQLDAAVRHCDSAVTLDSHDADAVIQRAVLAYQFEDKAAAAALLLDAVLNEHGSGLLNAQRREVKVHLAAARRLSGQPSAAISLLDEVLEDDSGFEPAHFHRGLALLTQGDANRAYDSLVNAESSSVDSFERARVLFHVGRAAAASGQNAEAIDAFGRSLDFDGDFLPSYLWRSGIHLSQRDPETAARLLLDHERTDPLEYRRTQLLTLYYEPLPDLEPVIERMLLALEAKPFAPHLTAALGVVLFHANRDAEARKVCQRAAEMDDRALLPHFYLALLDARNGRGRDARRRMEKLVEKSHNIGIHHAVLGNLHLKAGQPEAALAALERSVAYGLRSSWAFGNLAETLVALGKTKEAGQKLEEALRLEDPAAIALEAKVRLGL